MGTALEFSESETNIAKKAASYKIESASVDGMDILAVMELAERYAEDVRSGQGPRFIEANTYRFRAHSMFDAELYREKSEVDDWKHRDPIELFYDYLKANDLANDVDVAAVEAEVEVEIDEAVEFAENGTWESPENLTRFVYSEEEPEDLYPLMLSETSTGTSTETTSLTYREALRAGVRQAMQTDERVFLMGEDVGCYGGAFAVSMGLLEEFGP
jgi:pyruvate dehydrogenase E1 component beta subunit/2-oxoisovalerate dehydrogenase E1 component